MRQPRTHVSFFWVKPFDQNILMKRAWRPGLGGRCGSPHEVEYVARVGEVLREPLQRHVDGWAHAVHNDLNALQLIHPPNLIRDTAKYPPYLRETGKPMSLKDLALRPLGTSIQGGSHSSVDDARATMGLYLLHKKAWEAALAKGTALPQRRATAADTHEKGGKWANRKAKKK